MAAPPSAYKDRQFLAVIGDEVGSICLTRLNAINSSRILSLGCSWQALAYELQNYPITCGRADHL